MQAQLQPLSNLYASEDANHITMTFEIYNLKGATLIVTSL